MGVLEQSGDRHGVNIASKEPKIMSKINAVATIKTLVLALISALPATPVSAQDKAKIVFISGKPSHGPMAHEHRAGNMILADALDRSGLNVETVLVSHLGYPEDTSLLQDAATVVIFCTGHRGHVLNPHLDEFDKLMKSGTGVVMIHWATEAEKGKPGEKFLEWMGGFCDLNWSVNPHWARNSKTSPSTRLPTESSPSASTMNGTTICGLSRT